MRSVSCCVVSEGGDDVSTCVISESGDEMCLKFVPIPVKTPVVISAFYSILKLLPLFIKFSSVMCRCMDTAMLGLG